MDDQIAMCELILNGESKTKFTPNPVAPKPTPLNFNPLLRVMFDMAGIKAPRADAYEAHVVQQEEAAND